MKVLLQVAMWLAYGEYALPTNEAADVAESVKGK